MGKKQPKKAMTKKGYEWLESDTEIYNLLITKQGEGDEILNLFNIQFMDESYTNEDMEEINRIYIVRDQTRSDGRPTTHDGDGYHTLVEIIIRTSNKNPVQAQQLLKTAVRCIDSHLEFHKMKGYTKINQIVPKYSKPGHLHEYRMELLCTEIKEKQLYPTLCKDLRVDLCVQIGIENTDKEWHKVYPNIINTHDNKPIQLHEQKYQDDDEIGFGGG